jgi:hypothetical protein
MRIRSVYSGQHAEEPFVDLMTERDGEELVDIGVRARFHERDLNSTQIDAWQRGKASMNARFPVSSDRRIDVN